MGVGSSVPQKEALLYVKTFQGKQIDLKSLLDSIFKWMLEKSDVLDYYALASPSECKLYAKSTEEGLMKLFKTLEIKPTEDAKTGKIYFQKLDTLKRIAEGISTTDDKYKELTAPAQQQLCMQIAYFYIRILQIFSALALSVLDTKIPDDYDTLTVRPAATVPGRPAPAPFLASMIQGRPLQPQQGGEIPYTTRFYIKARSYTPLNLYLTYENGVFQLNDAGKKKDIYIQPNNLIQINEEQKDALTLTAKMTDVEGTKRDISALLKMAVQEGGINDSYIAEIIAMEINRQPIESRDLSTLRNRAEFKLAGNVYRYGKQNIPQWIAGFFQRALGFETDEDGEEEEEGRRYGVGKKKERKSIEKNMPADFPESIFGIKKLSAILKDSKPKAYCVSRAIQLLSPEQIYKDIPSPARTRICNSTFALSDSSPVLGKSVQEVKGLFYLEKLFYDKIVGSTPKISDALLPQHTQFMNELKALYEPKATSIGKGALDIGSIKEENPALCQTKGQGVYFTKDREVIRTLREFVGRLLNRQIQHTGNVVRLLSELFIISTTEPLQIQPSVWKKGMPEIERIAGKARELLMAYYNDCEVTYQEGALYISKQAGKFDK